MSDGVALVWRVLAIGAGVAVALLAGGVGATYMLRAMHLRAQHHESPTPRGAALRAAVGEMRAVFELLVLRLLRIDARRLPQAAEATAVTPVILVHGFSADGTSMWPLARALARAGHPVHTPHLGRMGRALPAYVLRLEQVVDAVLAPLPVGAQVDFVAHSLGGVMVRGLLQKRPDIRARVRRVVTVASPHRGTLVATGIPLPEARDVRVGAAFLDTLTPLEQLIAAEQVLTFSSAHDAIVYPASTCAVPGAVHHAFDGVGHAQLLFDARVLRLVCDAVAAA